MMNQIKRKTKKKQKQWRIEFQCLEICIAMYATVAITEELYAEDIFSHANSCDWSSIRFEIISLIKILTLEI